MGVLVVAGVALTLTFGAMFASGQGEHGFGLSKGCETPTQIGNLYTCGYTLRNNSDDFGDDLTVTSMGSPR